MAEMMEEKETYLEATSVVRRGKETVVIWSLKGWKENHATLRRSTRLVDVKEDSSFGYPDVIARLRFFFEIETSQYDHQECGDGRDDEHSGVLFCYRDTWLNLCISEVSNLLNHRLQYDIKVDLVDENGNVQEESRNSVEETIDFKKMKGSDQGKVKSMCFKHKFLVLKRTFTSFSASMKTADRPQPTDLRLKISVTPIHIPSALGHRPHTDDAEKQEEKEAALCKAILRDTNTYNDLRMEMKDGLTLRSHKFILAARSPVLRDLIDRQGENGTVSVKEVNARPMALILRWMYTGELHENAGKRMDELVEAAVHLEVTDLIKDLDKEKMISFCNPENMFQLFRTAQKYEMGTAKAEISKFIRIYFNQKYK